MRGAIKITPPRISLPSRFGRNRSHVAFNVLHARTRRHAGPSPRRRTDRAARSSVEPVHSQGRNVAPSVCHFHIASPVIFGSIRLGPKARARVSTLRRRRRRRRLAIYFFRCNIIIIIDRTSQTYGFLFFLSSFQTTV